jgi:hypothetical protein
MTLPDHADGLSQRGGGEPCSGILVDGLRPHTNLWRIRLARSPRCCPQSWAGTLPKVVKARGAVPAPD